MLCGILIIVAGVCSNLRYLIKIYKVYVCRVQVFKKKKNMYIYILYVYNIYIYIYTRSNISTTIISTTKSY
jgi:hypothetical protein